MAQIPRDSGLGEALANLTLAQLGPESARRIAALLAARDVAPNADALDRFRVANYILTGSAEFPDQEEIQRVEVRRLYDDETASVTEPPEHYCPMCHQSVAVPVDGYTTELGGQRFTKAQWEAVQAYLAGPGDAETVRHPDDPGVDLSPPDVYDQGGIIDRLAEEVEPAPSAGEGWKGRLG